MINTTSTAVGLFKAASVANKTDCTQCTTKSNKYTTHVRATTPPALSFIDTYCLRPDQVWVNYGPLRPPTLSQSVKLNVIHCLSCFQSNLKKELNTLVVLGGSTKTLPFLPLCFGLIFTGSIIHTDTNTQVILGIQLSLQC